MRERALWQQQWHLRKTLLAVALCPFSKCASSSTSAPRLTTPNYAHALQIFRVLELLLLLGFRELSSASIGSDRLNFALQTLPL